MNQPVKRLPLIGKAIGMRKLWNSLRRWEKIFLVISPILAAPIVAGVIYGIYLDFQPPPPLSPMKNTALLRRSGKIGREILCQSIF